MRYGLGAVLRRRYLYTWFIFGSAFLLLCYRWPKEGQAFNIGPPLLLLLIYLGAGQLAATICAYWAECHAGYEPAMALFVSSIQVGLGAAIMSVLLHLGILHLPFQLIVDRPEFRSFGAALVGAAIFPFMGCISAAATI